ncbi:MAG: 50S ribosomal protein L35 [Actinomycetia bacterium]|nr:50S ribosomal protein L35 [Actinomycetes bacterium]
MPKRKTHKGAAKRFKVTGSGKIVREKAYKSHKLAPKDSTRKRRLGQRVVVSKADEKKVRRLLGK